ncbi:MAG: tetratricopeptide repeat protein [Pseudomonadota bacterium]|nr:tetratricopeptide repeat protein [Pseudomonadota bacterium]
MFWLKRQLFGLHRRNANTANFGAPILFGFTDGQGALPWLAQNLVAIFTILLLAVLIAALAALLYTIVRELRRNTVFLDPIDVPHLLAVRGYSPAVVAERLLDSVLAMQRKAPTLKELRGVDSCAALVDLQVPARFSLQAIVRSIHQLLRIPEEHIGGEVTREGACYELTLRRRDLFSVTIVGVHRRADIQSLLAAGAEDVLRAVDPWILAHHYFAQETTEQSPEFTRTLATLEHMMQRAPAAERPWALNMQGICLMQQRQLPQAIERFRDAVAAGPQLPVIHQNWANALDLMGRFDEARAHRVRALEVPARTTDLLANNAINASLLHRRDQALALARRALALAPDNSRAWSAWGHVLFGLHRLEQAATAGERAMALGARDMFSAPPLAMVYAALGRPEKALAAALNEIERAGETEDALKGMGFARLAAGDARGAVANFDGALANAPGAGDAAYGRADALRALGEPELALAYYERAVAVDPFYPQAHAGWAHALRALGRIDEAPARFAVAVRVDSAYAPAYRGWADALQALGRNDEARPLLERAEAVERRNRELLPLR